MQYARAFAKISSVAFGLREERHPMCVNMMCVCVCVCHGLIPDNAVTAASTNVICHSYDATSLGDTTKQQLTRSAQ